MSEPTKFMQVDQLVNAHYATEDLFPHGLITDALSPPNSGDATKTSVVKHLETLHIITSQRPRFRSVEKNNSHGSLIHSAFQTKRDTSMVPYMVEALEDES
ncbi:hypothetical protein, partial [Acinetobacter baumannii]|uniref:hypothetical protein n=1 Tax=Acinetobacter baumannii TaxID=470 RepID=UPI003397D6DD